MRLSFAVALTFAIAGCQATGLPIEDTGGSSSPGFDLSQPGPYDFAIGGFPTIDLGSNDLSGGPSPMSAVTCGEMTCTGGNACCITRHQGMTQYACMATCDPNEISLSCDGPEDCTNDTCCATLAVGGMGGMGGGGMSSSSSCESATNDCGMGNIDFGSQSITTKLCHVTADCAGYQGNLGAFDVCCTRMGSPFSFCGPEMLDGQGGFTCDQ